jgi:hypothetical protein
LREEYNKEVPISSTGNTISKVFFPSGIVVTATVKKEKQQKSTTHQPGVVRTFSAVIL